MASNTITFPGITAVHQFAFTLLHGIQPSVATIVSPVEHVDVNTLGNGTLTITCDDGNGLTLTDCIPGSVSTSYTFGGNFVEVPIYDRRWRWGFGEIQGHYNERDKKGEIIHTSRKNAVELARTLVPAAEDLATTIV